ncbi:MAG: ankyrin repeat domain-containing protein [Gammaproteobacteria bacterium]|nr:ankyrin repeat domain-containing protein [Gammaproteobacteria bacterium]
MTEKPAKATVDLTEELLQAAMDGEAARCQEAIKAGADVNAASETGKTALYWAARAGDTEICRMLIDAGADANASDKDGWIPLHAAVSRNRTETAKLLINAGIDADTKNSEGLTALDVARLSRQDAVARAIEEAISLRHSDRTKALKVLRDRKRKE